MKKVKFFVINSILITIDQIFKYYILINKENLPNNIINGVLNFTYCENRGIAFGIGQGGAKIFALMTLLMIIVALIYIAFKFNKLKDLTVFGIALVISGGIGNLIDPSYSLMISTLASEKRLSP